MNHVSMNNDIKCKTCKNPFTGCP